MELLTKNGGDSSVIVIVACALADKTRHNSLFFPAISTIRHLLRYNKDSTFLRKKQVTGGHMVTSSAMLWSDEEFADPIPAISDTLTKNSQIVAHLGDTYEFLQTLPASLAKLIITSPPYNVGKEYETRADIHEYLSLQAKVIDELVRLLADNGSICWQVGNYVKDGEVFPLDILFYDIFKRKGLKLRNRIIWRYSHGLHTSKRFSGRYETILWFTKSDEYTFNLDPVRVPSKYPGKRHHKFR
jgi:DNA methylase